MSERFLSLLEDRYRRKGYEVLGRFSHQGGPAEWIGPLPDLYVENKKNRLTLYAISSPEQLGPKGEALGLSQVLENRDIKVYLDLFSKEAYVAARAVRKSLPRKLSSRVKLFRVRRGRTRVGEQEKFRMRQYEFRMAFYACIVGFAIILSFKILVLNDPFGKSKGIEPFGYDAEKYDYYE